MSLPREEFFEFGPYRLLPSERRLYREGSPVPLSPKEFETLLLLVRRSGHLVTKDDFFRELWPNTVVEENALNQKISVLRKTLEEGSGGARYIETVPKAGYRFIAPVCDRASEPELPAAVPSERPTLAPVAPSTSSPIAAPVPAPIASSPGAPSPMSVPAPEPVKPVFRTNRYARLAALVAAGALLVTFLTFLQGRAPRLRISAREVHSIAVLPLRSLGGGEEDRFLGLGIADSLITRLTYLREVAVRPTSAVRKYASLSQDAVHAGRELGVDAVLDGTIQKSGDVIRVTVQFVAVRDGAPIWSAKLDEKSADLFTVEDRISEQVVNSLALSLSGAEKERLSRAKSVDPQAYEDYLKGRYFWNQRTPDSFRTAQGWFERAVAKDSGYALAYAGLADNQVLMASFGVVSPRIGFPAAEAAANQALRLDPSLSQPHAALGYSKLFFDWDWTAAQREFRRAIDLNPNYPTAHHWYSNYLMAMGDPAGAIREIEKARQLDPLSLPINSVLATHLWYAGKSDEAVAQVGKAQSLDPHYAVAHEILGLIYESRKQYPQAEAEFRKDVELSGGPFSIASLGHLYAMTGERQKAKESIAKLEKLSVGRQVLPFGIPRIYAALGEMDQAFAWLERAFADRAGDLVWMKVDPRAAEMRGDPRFDQLLRRIGFAS